MEGLGPGDWGAGEESFKRFAGCPLGSGMGLAGTEDEEGQGRFEAEAAARCINFDVSLSGPEVSLAVRSPSL